MMYSTANDQRMGRLFHSAARVSNDWNWPVLLLPILGSLALALSTVAAPLVILPLGDSITQGASQPASVPGGYRDPLRTLLTNAGYQIQFVGSASDNATAALTASGNATHEGHGGYTTSNLLVNLDANGGTSGNNGGFWITGNGGSRPAIPGGISGLSRPQHWMASCSASTASCGSWN